MPALPEAGDAEPERALPLVPASAAMTSHRQLARARRLVEMWAADNRIDDLAVEWAWSDDTIASASECFRVAASLALDGMPATGPYTSPPCTPGGEMSLARGYPRTSRHQ